LNKSLRYDRVDKAFQIGLFRPDILPFTDIKLLLFYSFNNFVCNPHEIPIIIAVIITSVIREEIKGDTLEDIYNPRNNRIIRIDTMPMVTVNIINIFFLSKINSFKDIVYYFNLILSICASLNTKVFCKKSCLEG